LNLAELGSFYLVFFSMCDFFNDRYISKVRSDLLYSDWIVLTTLYNLPEKKLCSQSSHIYCIVIKFIMTCYPLHYVARFCLQSSIHHPSLSVFV